MKHCRENTAYFRRNSRRASGGFTLVEMVVAISLMSAAMVFVSVIFLNSFIGQRKIIASEQANSNARILMDTLSREIRVSTICGNTGGVRACKDPNNNTPTPPSTDLEPDQRLDIIRASDGVRISYCAIGRVTPPPPPYDELPHLFTLKRLVNDQWFSFDPCRYDELNSVPLNSNQVAILRDDPDNRGISGFITKGVGQWDAGGGCSGDIYDRCQPRVTIVLYVQSLTQKEVKERSEVKAQTTLTQRLIDIP